MTSDTKPLTEVGQDTSLRILAAVSRLRYFTAKEVAAHAEVGEEAVQSFIRRHPDLIEKLDERRSPRVRGRPERCLRLRPDQCDRVATRLAELSRALNPWPHSGTTSRDVVNPLRMLEATVRALSTMSRDDPKYSQEIEAAELQLAGAQANLRDRRALSRPVTPDDEQRLDIFRREIERLRQGLEPAKELIVGSHPLAFDILSNATHFYESRKSSIAEALHAFAAAHIDPGLVFSFEKLGATAIAVPDGLQPFQIGLDLYSRVTTPHTPLEAPHWHSEHTEAYLLAEGEAEVLMKWRWEVGWQRRVLQRGDIILIRPDSCHWFRWLSDKGLAFVFKAPQQPGIGLAGDKGKTTCTNGCPHYKRGCVLPDGFNPEPQRKRPIHRHREFQ